MDKSHRPFALPSDLVGRSLLVMLAIIGLSQIIMAFRFEVNQDEFYSLNMIYEMIRGEVDTPFQTVFQRVFAWLQYVPGQEVDQIVAGRLVLTLCGLITAWLIFKISRRYASTNASLFAVLGFFSFFYVFRHLTAFRVDGVVTVFLMGAVFLAGSPEQNWKKVSAAGVLIGAACMVTLKSVFYLPIIAAFLLTRWMGSGWGRREFMQGLAMAAISIASFVMIYIWHDRADLVGQENIAYLQNISTMSVFGGGFLNRSNALLTSLLFNPVGWALILSGLFVVASSFASKRDRGPAARVSLILFAFPLTTIFYYFHANPYYYIFIIAPAAVFIAVAADRFLITKRPPLFVILIAIMGLLVGRTFVQSWPQDQKDQRTVIAAAHEIFPSGVNTIDYCGMMSSYDRINETGWFINPDVFAMEKYYTSGPVLQTILPKYRPELIVANVNGLDLENNFEHQFDAPLLAEDTETLRANYIRFWGPLYIPGKSLPETGSFEILISGTYTVNSDSDIEIDTIAYKSGSALNLSAGKHQFSLLDNKSATLVWGDNIKKPDLPEPENALFNGF